MITTNKNIFGAIMCTVLIGCSDSGGVTGADNGKEQLLLKGVVDSSFYKISNVCLDENRNLLCEKNEKQTLTDANGNYQLTVNATEAAKYHVIAEVLTSAPTPKEKPTVVSSVSNTQASDQSIKNTIAYVLTAPIGKHAFISPISNLVTSFVDTEPMLEKEVLSVITRVWGVTEVEVLNNYLDAEKFGEMAEVMQNIASLIAHSYVNNVKSIQEKFLKENASELSLITANQMNNLLNKPVIDYIDTLAFTVNSELKGLTPLEYDVEDMVVLNDYYADFSISKLNLLIERQDADVAFLDKKALQDIFEGEGLFEFFSYPDQFTSISYEKNSHSQYRERWSTEEFSNDGHFQFFNEKVDLHFYASVNGWETIGTIDDEIRTFKYYLTDKGWEKQSDINDFFIKITDNGIEFSDPSGNIVSVINLVPVSMEGMPIAEEFYVEEEILDKSLLFEKGAIEYKRYVKQAPEQGYYLIDLNYEGLDDQCTQPIGFDCPNAPYYENSARHTKHTLINDKLEEVPLTKIEDLFLSDNDESNPESGLGRPAGFVYLDLLRLYRSNDMLKGRAEFKESGRVFESGWEMESLPGGIELLSIDLPFGIRDGEANKSTKLFFTMVNNKLVHGHYVGKGNYLTAVDLVGQFFNKNAKEQMMKFRTTTFIE